MRVLFDHPFPFSLAHGGFQFQIEQTRAALQQLGVEVEWLRWWDDAQRGDVIHYFGRPLSCYVDFAHLRGTKVVMSELLTALGSRSPATRAFQRIVMRLASKALPSGFTARLAWETYRSADAVIAGTSWEATLMQTMFRTSSQRLHIVPNGVESVFFRSQRLPRGDRLLCTATITERKRVCELAQAAIAANTPLDVIGKPYSPNDPHMIRFAALVEQNPQLLRWEGPIQDRAQLAVRYRACRGFVLLSDMETRSLAAEEAAACECPLLLSDLPWARSVFGNSASYCPVPGSVRQTAQQLRRFCEAAPGLPIPPKPKTWLEVAEQLRSLYQQVASTSS